MNNLLNGIAYCSFFCTDFDKMLQFYRDTLELKVAYILRNEDGTPKEAWMKVTDRQFIKLINRKYTGENTWSKFSFGHYSLLVKDIFAAMADLEAKGILITDGPSANKNYFLVPYKTVAQPACCGSMTAWVQDPEGNEIELMQYTDASMQLSCLE